jgi:hypothetical protein
LSRHAKDFGLLHARYLTINQKGWEHPTEEKDEPDFRDDCRDSEAPCFESITKTDLDSVNAEAIRILSSRFPNFDQATIASAVQGVFKALELEIKSARASPAPTTSTVPASPSPTPETSAASAFWYFLSYGC